MEISKYQFVCDLNNKGAKGKPFGMTLDELEEEISTAVDSELGDGYPPNFHEQFTAKCIPYIDLDCLTSTDRDGYITMLRSAIAQVFGDVTVILADCSGHSTKHNQYKISLRAFIRGAGYFSCPPACGKFMVDNFKPLLNIDLDAYKTRKNMGVVYNTKMGDPRILELLDGKTRISWDEDQSLGSTIIQNVEGEDKCIDPEGWEQVDGGGDV